MSLSSQAVGTVRAGARAAAARTAPRFSALAPKAEAHRRCRNRRFRPAARIRGRGARPICGSALKGTESISLAKLVIQAVEPRTFQSSRAQLTEGFEPLIGSIAKVILENQDLIGNITVVGHTDSVPLQRSNPLSTNQRLSEARAATIADILIQNGVPEDRVRSEGRAATDPVADNGTREGRALNRRVEVLVEKRL